MGEEIGQEDRDWYMGGEKALGDGSAVSFISE
jgi:hypothetical protein